MRVFLTLVDAATFNGWFDELVVRPTQQVGLEPWGKSLWMERDGLQVALIRTGRPAIWPYSLTLIARHVCLRDFDDRMPPPRSRNASEYPVKVAPSQAKSLVKRYRYKPYNLGKFPDDLMDPWGDERKVRRLLEKIGRTLADVVPVLPDCLTPEVVLREIERHGEGAWVEARWIEDYRKFLASGPGPLPP
jgi:hypothetical protein